MGQQPGGLLREFAGMLIVSSIRGRVSKYLDSVETPRAITEPY